MAINPSGDNSELIDLLSRIFLNPMYPDPGEYGQNPIPRPPNELVQHQPLSPHKGSASESTQALSLFNSSYYQLTIDVVLAISITKTLSYFAHYLDHIPFAGKKIGLALKTVSYLGAGLVAYFGMETKNTRT